MLMLMAILAVVAIAFLVKAGSSRPADLGANDVTGSNDHVGRILMGDDVEFGKGLS